MRVIFLGEDLVSINKGNTINEIDNANSKVSKVKF